MSTQKRPWYKWYPKDFNVDEKVRMLSFEAKAVYRELLDIMWQSNECRLINDYIRLHKATCPSKTIEEFKEWFTEIQTPGDEIFKTSKDKKWLYSKRLKIEHEGVTHQKLKNKRAGIASGIARNKRISEQVFNNCSTKDEQTLNHTDSDTDTDTDKRLKEVKTDGKKAVPFKNLISHGSIPKVKSEIQEIGKELYDKKTFPEVFAFINKMLKEQKSERAILHTLTRCCAKAIHNGGFKKDGGPWAYCMKIIQVENGNYNELEFRKTKTPGN